MVMKGIPCAERFYRNISSESRLSHWSRQLNLKKFNDIRTFAKRIASFHALA
jgi:hypothetical protein